jgi:MtaA/CmuA family methyltransferase
MSTKDAIRETGRKLQRVEFARMNSLMNGLKRTLDFIAGLPVDRPPFHPIVMQWAARYAGVTYRDFCLKPEVKAAAMVRVAEDFAIDWATVMSDPYCEAEAFGIKVDYPEDSLPVERSGHLLEAEEAYGLKPYRIEDHRRLQNRLREIEELKARSGGELFIVGWVEGPMAEYADLRGVSEAAVDLIEEPEAVAYAMRIIVDAAIEFARAQVAAGANCIGIGDAFASQIGPQLYQKFVQQEEQRLIEAIHGAGALVKLHICGNTAPILRGMIATGANIIDVDHLVPDMSAFVSDLGPRQVFSGKCDPVSVIQDGHAASIQKAVCASYAEAKGRAIISAGCEIPRDTPNENMRAFSASVKLCSIQPPAA